MVAAGSSPSLRTERDPKQDGERRDDKLRIEPFGQDDSRQTDSQHGRREDAERRSGGRHPPAHHRHGPVAERCSDEVPSLGLHDECGPVLARRHAVQSLEAPGEMRLISKSAALCDGPK
jgi:hypothetical protein